LITIELDMITDVADNSRTGEWWLAREMFGLTELHVTATDIDVRCDFADTSIDFMQEVGCINLSTFLKCTFDFKQEWHNLLEMKFIHQVRLYMLAIC